MSKAKTYTKDDLYKAGVFKPKHVLGLDLRDKIRSLVKTGLSKTQAVKRIASETRHSESYIWAALKSVKDL